MFKATFVINQSNGYQQIETSLEEVEDAVTGVTTNRQLSITGVFKEKEQAEIMIQHLLKKQQAEAEANLQSVKFAARIERERKKKKEDPDISNFLIES